MTGQLSRHFLLILVKSNIIASDSVLHFQLKTYVSILLDILAKRGRLGNVTDKRTFSAYRFEYVFVPLTLSP